MNRLDTNIKRVPKLRFKEFSSELQTLQFGDFLKSISSGKSSTRNISMGKYLFYGSTGVIGHTDNAEYVGKKILIARVGANAGSIYFADDRYAVSDNTLVVELQPGLNTDFIFYYLKKYNLMRMVFGSGQPLVTGGQIKKIQITVPKNNEQHKIAEFLTSVDKRIELQDKKVKLLEKYKKGIMQKIFSQQIRFKDELGKAYPERQEKKLEDIAYSETSPLSANSIVGKSGDYIVYGASGVLQTLDTYHYEEEYIAIVKDGAGVGRISYCKPKSSVLGTMIVVQPKKETNKKFLFYLLHLINFKKYTTGSTIPHVYFNQYSKTKFHIPTIYEQQKIAEFLTSIDDKIDLEKNKLKQAKQFKKALLQQMFV